MLGKISLQYESSYKNISTAKFYFKWLSLLYPRLLQFYFFRHTPWKNEENCHLCTFCLFLRKRSNFKGDGFFPQVLYMSRAVNAFFSFIVSLLSKWAILFLLTLSITYKLPLFWMIPLEWIEAGYWCFFSVLTNTTGQQTHLMYHIGTASS